MNDPEPAIYYATIYDRYDQALAFLDAGKALEAEAMFTRLLIDCPGNPLVLSQRDRCIARVRRKGHGLDQFWHMGSEVLDHHDLEACPVNGTVVIYEIPELAPAGFGDAIQWVRSARDLALEGKSVWLAPRPRLRRLFSSIPCICGIVPMEIRMPFADCYVPLQRLQRRSHKALSDPYLQAEPDLVKYWDSRLQPGARNIGIHWSGSAPEREVPLLEFDALARLPGVELVSLQKGIPARDLRSIPFVVCDMGSALDNGPDAFVDTAALMQSLDHIVTNDTSVGHLAGALGRPVTVIWADYVHTEWAGCTDTTPLYPSMRFEQRRPGEGWRQVFERIASYLEGK